MLCFPSSQTPWRQRKITRDLPDLGSQWQWQHMESEAQLRQAHHMTAGNKGERQQHQQQGLKAGWWLTACYKLFGG